jgi:hypothetical protein
MQGPVSGVYLKSPKILPETFPSSSPLVLASDSMTVAFLGLGIRHHDGRNERIVDPSGHC